MIGLRKPRPAALGLPSLEPAQVQRLQGSAEIVDRGRTQLDAISRSGDPGPELEAAEVRLNEARGALAQARVEERAGLPGAQEAVQHAEAAFVEAQRACEAARPDREGTARALEAARERLSAPMKGLALEFHATARPIADQAQARLDEIAQEVADLRFIVLMAQLEPNSLRQESPDKWLQRVEPSAHVRKVGEVLGAASQSWRRALHATLRV